MDKKIKKRKEKKRKEKRKNFWNPKKKRKQINVKNSGGLVGWKKSIEFHKHSIHCTKTQINEKDSVGLAG